MIRQLSMTAVFVAAALAAQPADAHGRRHVHYPWDYRYLPLRLGYHRNGPAHGPGFGFATYRGDPFYSDDYYDGRGCYYLHHRYVCLNFRPPLDPFN